MNDEKKNLRIRIIGAGMGGLSVALALAKKGFQDIQVFETASNLGFVGAGIQLAPNMGRILDRLGVWADVEKEAVILKDASIRQGSTNTELAHPTLHHVKENYGYYHCVGHRANLAGSIYEGCKREPAIKFIFSTSLVSIDAWEPKAKFTVKPRDGEEYQVEADLLLAADGIKSVTRVAMLKDLGVEANIKDTNQSAYRIMLTREQMQHDPEMLELISGQSSTRWIGERRHIIAYPVSSNTIYNLSTAQPDTNFAATTNETYTTKGSKQEMIKVFEDFCPLVHRMLDLVPEGEVCEWKLRVHEPIPTWVHGAVALLGDACHPTLPHLNQGAAQAIEDAGVIGECLALAPDTSLESINKSMRVYEKVRKERADTLVEMAAESGRNLHLGEGKAKEERDRAFKEGKGKMPDKWADADVQRMIYGFDAMEVAKSIFEEEFAKL